MATAISERSKLEEKLEQQLRSKILSEISRRNISSKEFAHILGIFPPTAEALLQQGSWPLQTSIRACEALDIEVYFR